MFDLFYYIGRYNYKLLSKTNFIVYNRPWYTVVHFCLNIGGFKTYSKVFYLPHIILTTMYLYNFFCSCFIPLYLKKCLKLFYFFEFIETFYGQQFDIFRKTRLSKLHTTIVCWLISVLCSVVIAFQDCMFS